MEPLRIVESRAAVVDHDNVDTDVITPARRILEGLDSMIAHAFEPLRFRADGTPDPRFSFNDPARRGARILLAGRNFGCGSSRETAVWAIAGLGIRCIVAPSFGDIFFANCFKNGLLPIVVDEQQMRRLMEMAGDAAALFAVDLEAREIRPPRGAAIPFSVSEVRREALLRGADEIGLAMRRRESIDAFVARDRVLRPWIYRDGASRRG
jgi:3-isopropylmalate/(R)-2-methylmalate dehydratase small subunit